MTESNLISLIDLLVLLMLLVGLTVWWQIKLGGTRGKIAQRALQAAVNHRLSVVEVEEPEDQATLRTRFLRRMATIGDKIPFDSKFRKQLQLEMLKGGFRSPLSVSILIAIKVCVGMLCAIMVVIFGSSLPKIAGFSNLRGILMPFMFIIGMIIPEYVLKFRAARRRSAMASALPDALDLLVICTNAGNSLGVSIRRVADELATICPPLSSEFSLTADELKLSGDSTRALMGLAQRIDLPSIRALISTLTQAMRYGTPITQALRTLSRTERVAHIVSLEEKAAKLAPKMVVPMMLFILPAVVAIAAGPAVIRLMEFVNHQ